MTVGKSSTGTLGYKKDSYGSLSTTTDSNTGAKFYYPPFSPPPKHNFDPESSISVTSLTRQVDALQETLFLHLTIRSRMPNTGNVTLWIGNKSFPMNATQLCRQCWLLLAEPIALPRTIRPTWSGQRATRSESR